MEFGVAMEFGNPIVDEHDNMMASTDSKDPNAEMFDGSNDGVQRNGNDSP